MPAPTYPKRLIEVDLPIKKISEHARREKSIRHGHISTLHVWWARRPLAACRAVICAALWPDPADPLCPERFRTEAEDIMRNFWNPIGVSESAFSDPVVLRQALLDFIADFSNWDKSIDDDYLSTARKLTHIAHESLGGEPGTRPLVVDPFAGGGSIPLEALRVGADAYASDLNPVAVLLNKVILEIIPKYRNELASEVRKWGKLVKEEAEKELIRFYPRDSDGNIPIAYLWARTIRCEGPGCGAEVPLIRSLWLAKKGKRSVGLRLIIDKEIKQINFQIIGNAKTTDIKDGTVKRGSATCPVCGFTTHISSVRKQLKKRHGGTDDSRLFCVVVRSQNGDTIYRIPKETDFEAINQARENIDQLKPIDCFPNEQTPLGGGKGAGRAFSQRAYGIEKFSDFFTARQLIMLITYTNLIKRIKIKPNNEKESVIKLLLAGSVEIIFLKERCP